jgi:cytochrome o ubiquinol oxidase operon protein cyoD
MTTEDLHAGHGHLHGGPEGPPGSSHGPGAPHGSLKGYLTGFGLSVLLTAVPFWLVMSGSSPGAGETGLIISGLAMVQIVVHIVFFLHMSPKSEGGWNMMAMAFTVIIVVIAVSGSVWIMHHLNTNMMPDMDMSHLP